MSWTYRQASGCLSDKTGAIVGVGYSGAADGKNCPTKQSIADIGPLPQGWYTIKLEPECTMAIPAPGGATCPNCGAKFAHKHGPFVLRLIPDPENEMFGRAGFLIHGDSITRPGCASEGCMCQQRSVRELVSKSGDDRLEVVS